MDFETIEQLEMELNDYTIRKSKARLQELIAEDFEEIGKSGRRFTKQNIIDDLLNEPAIDYSVQNFRFTALASDCVLVKYQTSIQRQVTHRCSIWKKVEGRWQIIYHQGTTSNQAHIEDN